MTDAERLDMLEGKLNRLEADLAELAGEVRKYPHPHGLFPHFHPDPARPGQVLQGLPLQRMRQGWPAIG